ncbi:hypothetical protein BDB01DRAFT_846512 [Pilobolus umbonatus]|nr:hypothetical protein BDB01DRAFT_846512 [Pilobolus umbonatus]
MAFRFTWPEFDLDFYNEAKSQLETALNKGNKPSVIHDYIKVKELHMGTTPPELEILDIGELGNDKFRGIFKLNYAGDAYIEVQTKVQANPMHGKQTQLPRHSRPGILAADQPLVVPMILRISELKMRGIIVLVVSKTKGVTLVFKNDPLESIRVSSTFDSISILRDFLQRQIEGQLRNMFQDGFPIMIHNLSLKYIQSKEEKRRKLEEEERLSRQSICLESCYGYQSSGLDIPSPPYINRALSDMESDYTSSPPTSVCTPLSRSFQLDNIYSVYDDSHYLSRSPTSTVFPPYDLKKQSFYGSSMSSFSDSLETLQENYCRSVPITSANLYKHNHMNQLGLNMPYMKEYFPPSYRGCSLADDSQSHATWNSTLYTPDDAPWYAMESAEYSNDLVIPQLNYFPMDIKHIVLRPNENSNIAKLAQLTKINYTLAASTDTISNSTFRSLPFVKKSSSYIHRQKKVPKRRIIKLNIKTPRL